MPCDVHCGMASPHGYPLNAHDFRHERHMALHIRKTPVTPSGVHAFRAWTFFLIGVARSRLNQTASEEMDSYSCGISFAGKHLRIVML